MTPGARETDALIAYHLFGWRWVPISGYPNDYRLCSPEDAAVWKSCLFPVKDTLPDGARAIPAERLPLYSSNASAALTVIDRLRAAGIEVVIGWGRYIAIELRQWRDRRAEGIPGDPHTGRSRVTYYCRTGCESMPRAVAEAALHPETLAVLSAAKSQPAAAMMPAVKGSETK